MTSETKTPEFSTHEIDWLLRLMKLVFIAGTLAIVTTRVYAQGTAPGFKEGAKPFSANPFADEGDEEEDEEADYTPPRSTAPNAAAGASQQNGSTISAGGQNRSEGTEPTRTRSGVSMGSPNASVTSKNMTPFINIDTMSGEGSKEKVTDFNFPDADIMDIAKTLGKLTGKNFILDKDVKGKITLITNGEITVGDAWRAFLTALDMNNFALVPSGEFIRITRQREARDKQLKTYTGDYTPDSDALITKIFRIKHVSPEEVAKAFHQFVPASARIFPYEATNTVIVTDSGSNIKKLEEVLSQLDVESFDAGIEVVPVKWASAAELSKLIDTLLPGANMAAAGGAPGMPRFGGGGSRFNSRRTKEGGVINTIIADERTNTLIVHANTKGADQVRELVAKLDQKLPAQTGGGKVHVVYLQFADAEALANTINNLSQSNRTSAPTAGTGGTGVNPTAQSLFEGNIRISPDKSTNSLVITGSPSDFVTVQRVINRLDIQRDEVYVEVVIMEVGVSKQFDFSANLISPANKMGITTASAGDIATFLSGGGTGVGLAGAVLGFGAGGTTPVTINNQTVNVSSVMGLVKLLQTNSNANVLATPQILAIDNTEATFETTEKIPMNGGTTITGTGLASAQIQQVPVTLSIKIKPQINKLSNFVKMDIETQSGDVSTRRVPDSLQGQAIATIDRKAKTTVVVGDADTAVLGGLIRDKIVESETKVPILGDIPILGWLFKSKTSQVEKTNMLIFLTPHIVRKYDKMRAILDKKLKERDDWLERTTGGKDPLKYRRDEIIRSLPDVQELANQKTGRSFDIEDDEIPAATVVTPSAGSSGTAIPVAPPAPSAEFAPPTAPMATPDIAPAPPAEMAPPPPSMPPEGAPPQ